MIEPATAESHPRMLHTPDGAAGASSGALQWRDLFTTFRRFWWLVAASSTLTVAGVGYLLWRAPPEYRAAAMLRLGEARRALTVGLDGTPLDAPRLADPLLSQVQLLRSRALIGTVVDSVGLRLRPDFWSFPPELLQGVRVGFDAPPDTLRLQFADSAVTIQGRQGEAHGLYSQPLQVAGVTFTVTRKPRMRRATWVVLPRDEAIDGLLEDLKVTRRPLTNIVDVTYATYRPAAAQQVVNTLVDLFQALSARSAREMSHRRRVFLEEQLRRTDSLLARAQLTLSAFRSRQQVYS